MVAGATLSVAGCRTSAAGGGGSEATESDTPLTRRGPSGSVAPAPVAPGVLPPLSRVGLQLSTVRALLERDIDDTFRQVAAIGYRNVETSADLYDKRKPADLRALLDKHGLRTTAGLYREEAIRDDTAGVARAAHTLGQQYVGLPTMSDASRTSREGFKQAAARYNAWGRRLRDEGLTLTYHNHAFEFQPMGGSSPAFDILLAETDPTLVAFELDLYWIDKSGQDPVAYMDRYPGRFHLLHLKDSTAAPEKAFAPVGAGRIDFRTILMHAGRAGMRYAFVEHDQPKDPLESIRTSYATLSHMLPRE